MKKFLSCPKCAKMARFATTLCPHCGYDASKLSAPTISPEVEAAAAELNKVDPIEWPDMPTDLFNE